MNERTKWAGALMLALTTNALLLIVILLQTSGLLFLYGTSSCDTTDNVPGRVIIKSDTAEPVRNTENGFPINSNRDFGGDLNVNDFSKEDSYGTQNPKQFVFFSTWRDRKPRSDRFEQEILDIISDESFVEKVLDKLVNTRDSGIEPPLSFSQPEKSQRDLFQTALKSLLSQWKRPRHLSQNDAQRDKHTKPLSSRVQQAREHGSVPSPLSQKDDDRTMKPRVFTLTSRSGHRSKDGQMSRRKKRDVSEMTLPQGDAAIRRSDVPPEDLYGLNGVLALEEIFSTLTAAEIQTLPEGVQTILLPALMHFEGMVIRQLESLHSAMVSHDLRLETLEKQHLNWLSNGGPPSNRSSDETMEAVDEEFLPVNTTSDMLSGNDEGGSGEGEDELTTTQTTTTTAATTTTEDRHIYEMYRSLSELEQKISALENYNLMSDSELIRTRNEVIKMDDKVTEMNRRHRNLKIRTAMQTYRVTELETFMGKTELALHTTLDAFSRMTQRLDSFKDRMSEYKSDIRNVQAQFGRQTQIMGELRSADSYKAHDINELRKSLLGLEERLNSLYRVLDQNVDTIRGDVRQMVERVCFNNNLSC